MSASADFFLSAANIAKHSYQFFTALGSNADQFQAIRVKYVTEILQVNPISKTSTANISRTEDIKLAAEKLEATFLAEMLKAAGFGEQENSFSGGSGEDQFASFHRQVIADQIAAAGGVGLTEHIMRALMETENGA
nr:rod-binding protein [Roseovarius sp. W115]